MTFRKQCLSTPKRRWKYASDLWFSVSLCSLHTIEMKYMIWDPTEEQESHLSKTNIMVLPFTRKIKVQGHPFATNLHKTLLGWSRSKSKRQLGHWGMVTYKSKERSQRWTEVREVVKQAQYNITFGLKSNTWGLGEQSSCSYLVWLFDDRLSQGCTLQPVIA